MHACPHKNTYNFKISWIIINIFVKIVAKLRLEKIKLNFV